MIARFVDVGALHGSEREQAEDAVRAVRQGCDRIRRDLARLTIWSHVPLAKSRREKYLKAIKLNYCSIVKAGTVLVRMDNPHLVENYASHAPFAA